MTHAIKYPNFPAGDRRAGQPRPIVEAAQLVVRAIDVGFLRSVARAKVDPESGRVVPRNEEPELGSG